MRALELRAGQSRQKIGLVFIFIHAPQQMHTGIIPVCACVVSGRDTRASELYSLLGEEIEFYEIIAEDIGIWRQSPIVALVDIVYDARLVFTTKIHDDEITDAQMLGDAQGIVAIATGGAAVVFGRIVFHKSGDDIPALPLQQICRDGGVDASGKPY